MGAIVKLVPQANVMIGKLQLPEIKNLLSSGHVQLSHGNVQEMKLEKLTVQYVDFRQCCFVGTSFQRSTFMNCRFFECDLIRADFTDTELTNVTIVDSYCEAMIMKPRRYEGVRFQGTKVGSIIVHGDFKICSS